MSGRIMDQAVRQRALTELMNRFGTDGILESKIGLFLSSMQTRRKGT